MGNGELYRILDPGPYCPETGQAHITCRAVVLAAPGMEALVAMAVAFRLMRVAVFISEAGEKAGMASGPVRQRRGGPRGCLGRINRSDR